MAAAQGNQYAAKERIWAAAINKALEERGKKLGRMGALIELAHKLLDKVAEADVSAIKELGDRLDGKAAQSVIMAGNQEAPLELNVSHRLPESAERALEELSGSAEAGSSKTPLPD